MNSPIKPTWPDGFITLAEAARRGGVTLQTAHGAVRTGRVPAEHVRSTEYQGRRFWAVNEAAAVPILLSSPSSTKNLSAVQSVPPPPPRLRKEEKHDYSVVGNATEQYNAVKIHREKLAVEKAEMELKLARGLLLEVEEVSIFLSTLSVETRQALLAIPPRIAPLVAAEKDTTIILHLLETEITQALEGLGKLATFAHVPAVSE